MELVEFRDNGNIPLFNIKAVVNQTGLHPATIRAWERRYGFPQPKRSDGGHRQYSQRDIDTLKWLTARQEEGVSISHAIEMWRSNIELGEDPILGPRTLTSDPFTPDKVHHESSQIVQLRRDWIEACLAFDRESAGRVLAQAFAQHSPDFVSLEILQKGLAEIGRGWYDGSVTIQQEHFASALSVQRLEMLIAAAPPPTRFERILVASAPGDHHIFSPLLLTFLLRQHFP